MNINNLYVVVYNYGGSNDHNTELVSDEVYLNKEIAEQSITNKKNMIAISLKEWAKENYDSGYYCAFG